MGKSKLNAVTQELVRIDPDYPHRVAAKLRFSCPPVLFCRGDRRLLALASVAAVGSRRLLPENAAFARQAGRLAARERLTLRIRHGGARPLTG